MPSKIEILQKAPTIEQNKTAIPAREPDIAPDHSIHPQSDLPLKAPPPTSPPSTTCSLTPGRSKSMSRFPRKKRRKKRLRDDGVPIDLQAILYKDDPSPADLGLAYWYGYAL